MFRAYVRGFLLIFTFTWIAGCASTNFVEIGRTEIDPPVSRVLHTLSSNKIVIVERRNGGNIHYNEEGANFFTSYQGEDSVIVGTDQQGTLSVTRLNQVNRVWMEKKEIDAVATILVAGGIAITALYVVLLIEFQDGFYNH